MVETVSKLNEIHYNSDLSECNIEDVLLNIDSNTIKRISKNVYNVRSYNNRQNIPSSQSNIVGQIILVSENTKSP